MVFQRVPTKKWYLRNGALHLCLNDRQLQDEVMICLHVWCFLLSVQGFFTESDLLISVSLLPRQPALHWNVTGSGSLNGVPGKSTNPAECCLLNYMFSERLASVMVLHPRKMLNGVILWLLFSKRWEKWGHTEDFPLKWCFLSNIF